MPPNTIHSASSLIQLNWTPGIGDPTFIGWLTVGAYFATSIFCVTCARQLARLPSIENASTYRIFWWIMAAALFLLGINKQLDLQTLLTEIAKVAAKRQGWYEQRRAVQEFFIAAIACGGFGFLLYISQRLKKLWKENHLALTGVVFLVSFIIIRATSFHGVDTILGLKRFGVKVNSFLELGGIACIWLSAIIQLNRNAHNKWRRIEAKSSFL